MFLIKSTDEKSFKKLDLSSIELDIKNTKKNIHNWHNNLISNLENVHVNLLYTNACRITDWYPNDLKDIYNFMKLVNLHSSLNKKYNLKISNINYQMYLLIIDNIDILDKFNIKINFSTIILNRLKLIKIKIYSFKKYLILLLKFIPIFIIVPFLKKSNWIASKFLYINFGSIKEHKNRFFGKFSNIQNSHTINYTTYFSDIKNSHHFYRNITIVQFLKSISNFFKIDFLSRFNLSKFSNNNKISNLNFSSFTKFFLYKNLINYNCMNELIFKEFLLNYTYLCKTKLIIYPFESKPIENVLQNICFLKKIKNIAFAHSNYDNGHHYTFYQLRYHKISFLWTTGILMNSYFTNRHWPSNKILTLGGPKSIPNNNSNIISKSNVKLKVIFLVGRPHDLIIFKNILKNNFNYFNNNVDLCIRFYPFSDYSLQINIFNEIKVLIPDLSISKLNLDEALNRNSISLFMNTSVAIESLFSSSYSIYLNFDKIYHNQLFIDFKEFDYLSINTSKNLVSKLNSLSKLNSGSFFKEILKQNVLANKIYTNNSNKNIYEIFNKIIND
jgi:hypothetical protein